MIKDGYVWGRGALDMKGHTATNAVALATLAREGFRPRGDLVLIAQADEEDGTEAVGMQWLVEARPDLRVDYALEAAIFIAGAAIQWLRDGLGVLTTAAQSEELARGTSSADGVYFVPALVGMGAPHWEPRARGTIVGLTRGSTRAHLVRAALEAMAYSTADVLEVMRAGATLGAGGPRTGREAPLRVDGGATENDWLMQFQADVLGIPVERPRQIQTTALGAAGLAGLAAGIWPDVDAFQATREFTRFEPGEGREAARAGAAGWARAAGREPAQGPTSAARPPGGGTCRGRGR